MHVLPQNSGSSGISFKIKARLSWITAVLKMFAQEFNCVGNHFYRRVFSHKFLRNHFLVLTFLKLILFGISVILSLLQ